MVVLYKCYQCDRENTMEQAETTNGLPFGWRMPPAHSKIVEVDAKRVLEPGTIVALCSDGCYSRYTRDTNES
jgi:hypothetical protein